MLAYAGAKIPKTAAGQNLRPIIDGKPAVTREALFGAIYPAFVTKHDQRPHRNVYALYVRTKKWKYILFVQDVVANRNGNYFRVQSILTDYPTRDKDDQDLYDLENDPHELNNLADKSEHKERLAKFRNDVLKWWETTGGKPLEK